MASNLSGKINNFIFEPKPSSASMLTCRRHTADMTQTVTQTKVLTLNEQDARRGAFSGRNGITTILLKEAVIIPLFCFFEIIIFIDRDFIYEYSR